MLPYAMLCYATSSDVISYAMRGYAILSVTLRCVKSWYGMFVMFVAMPYMFVL